VVTLEASDLFGQLSPGELEVLRGLARERTFVAGQEIFREGDAGDAVYAVKDGLVEISTAVTPDQRLVYSRIGPGEIFGEMAVLEDKPRSACAVACEATAVYVLPRAGVLKLVEGSPALALALLREISSRLRDFNRQYLREVVQAERLAVVGRFARAIIHDLKNPLNIIGLTAEMAGLPGATPQQRQTSLATIRQQVERISEMVGEVLDFTQGAASELVLPPLDYAGFVEQVVAELRPEAALKGLELELENSPPAVGLCVNPRRLRQVFANLVHNATDAMPDGGKVRLRFQSGAAEVVTEIEDSGPGLAPELAGHLFEAFITHGKTHGTGLGLSICKRILEDHHGWIAARTEPGHGAIFAFGLPLPKSGAAANNGL